MCLQSFFYDPNSDWSSITLQVEPSLSRQRHWVGHSWNLDTSGSEKLKTDSDGWSYSALRGPELVAYVPGSNVAHVHCGFRYCSTPCPLMLCVVLSCQMQSELQSWTPHTAGALQPWVPATSWTITNIFLNHEELWRFISIGIITRLSKMNRQASMAFW